MPKFYLELVCEHGGETHGVRSLEYMRETGENKYTVQPVAYCGALCGFCDVVARTVTTPSDFLNFNADSEGVVTVSAVTCGACLKELEFRKGEDDDPVNGVVDQQERRGQDPHGG